MSSAVATATTARTHHAATSAMHANPDCVDAQTLIIHQAGEAALAAGDLRKATTRFAEVLHRIARLKEEVSAAGGVEAIATTSIASSKFSGSAVKPSSPRAQHIAFANIASCCATCGATAPKETAWLSCMACHRQRYCSAQCRKDGFAWGHSASCGVRGLPQSAAAVAALDAEAAVGVLKEHGRAHPELAMHCVQRVLAYLESHLQGAPL